MIFHYEISFQRQNECDFQGKQSHGFAYTLLGMLLKGIFKLEGCLVGWKIAKSSSGKSE